MNILLHGAVSGSNFGDCLFADIFYNSLRQSFPDDNIWFFDRQPFGISQYLRSSLDYRYIMSDDDYNKVDALVYISGGYLGEDKKSLKESLVRYKRYVQLGKKYISKKIPILIIGLEVGPIYYGFLRKGIRNIIDRSVVLTVRNKESYDYCKIFWSGILVKGMEQGITQLGLSVASVTDELKWINSSLINNTKRFSDMTYKNDSAFFQFSVFVEFYLFESYLQTYRIFDVLRDVKLDNIKSNFNVILYCYLIGSIVLVAIAFYFVNDSKYLLNSFLNFVGIFPVKYLMEDNSLYHETLNLETDIF